MPLFRDVNGRFYEISQDLLDKSEVKKDAMDEAFRKQHVSGVQIPRQDGQCGCEDAAQAAPSAQTPTIILNQYFGAAIPTVRHAPNLPSDIQLAHYGTTIDNPKN